MAERRTVGEGSVYRRKDKDGKIMPNDWVSQITVNGKRKTFTGKTKKEALDKLEEFKGSLRFQNTSCGTDITLAEYLKNWLWQEKKRKLKATSFDRLECTIKCSINPYIGSLKLSELSYEVIQYEMINKLEDEGKAYTTIKKAYDTMNDAIKHALFPMRILSENPMLGVQMPSKERFEKKEIRYFSDDEIKRFRTAALALWGNGSRIYPLGDAMILMLNTGVRVGEALAWTWKDYDEEKGIIKVAGNLVRVKDREKGESHWKMALQTPKTESGIRLLPVNAAAKEALDSIKKIRYFGQDSPILAQEDGSFNTIDNFTRTYEAILKRAGIEPCGIHTLRHTFATQMIAKGVDVKVVSTLLGHSSVEITYNVYVHVLKEQSVQAMELLETI